MKTIEWAIICLGMIIGRIRLLRAFCVGLQVGAEAPEWPLPPRP